MKNDLFELNEQNLLLQVEEQFQDAYGEKIKTKIKDNKLIILFDDNTIIEYCCNFKIQENIFRICKGNDKYKVSNKIVESTNTNQDYLSATMDFIFNLHHLLEGLEQLSLNGHINSLDYVIIKE